MPRPRRGLAVLALLAAVLPGLPIEPSQAADTTPYLQVCGPQLCSDGRVFPVRAASVLAATNDPSGEVAEAVSARLDLIRVVNFLDESGDPGTAAYDEQRWERVDQVIADAQAAGLRVELDLSTYRNLLLRNGINPYAADWQPFVSYVTNRRNTVTGTRYGSDPTIALVAFAGEVEPPGSPGTSYTAGQITTFFARTLAEWKAEDPHHLLTTGGLFHLDGADNGIDWKTIFALPVVDVPSIHVYSRGDLVVALPRVGAWSRHLHKPWLTEEFGADRSVGDSARAHWFSLVYLQSRLHGGVGAGFWNLGPQTTGPTYDVNASTPRTLAVVRSQDQPPTGRGLWRLVLDLRRLRNR